MIPHHRLKALETRCAKAGLAAEIAETSRGAGARQITRQVLLLAVPAGDAERHVALGADHEHFDQIQESRFECSRFVANYQAVWAPGWVECELCIEGAGIADADPLVSTSRSFSANRLTLTIEYAPITDHSSALGALRDYGEAMMFNFELRAHPPQPMTLRWLSWEPTAKPPPSMTADWFEPS